MVVVVDRVDVVDLVPDDDVERCFSVVQVLPEVVDFVPVE